MTPPPDDATALSRLRDRLDFRWRVVDLIQEEGASPFEVAEHFGLDALDVLAWCSRLWPEVDGAADLRVVAGEPLSTPFVFVISFRNQAQYLAKCLRSILAQNRAYRFGIVLMDDASTDDSIAVAQNVLSADDVPYVIVANPTRRYKSRNLYNAVRYLITDPRCVILQVDADDWLVEDRDVLAVIHAAYAGGARLTLGSFDLFPLHGETAFHRYFRPHQLCTDMRYPWHRELLTVWAHLKTFRRDLFLRVPMRYFVEPGENRWIQLGDDVCITPAMVELAGPNSAFIREVLYTYSVEGSHHDFLIDPTMEYYHTRLYKSPDGTHKSWLARQSPNGSDVRFARDIAW